MGIHSEQSLGQTREQRTQLGMHLARSSALKLDFHLDSQKGHRSELHLELETHSAPTKASPMALMRAVRLDNPMAFLMALSLEHCSARHWERLMERRLDFHLGQNLVDHWAHQKAVC